jgi:hypothetical protein
MFNAAKHINKNSVHSLNMFSVIHYKLPQTPVIPFFITAQTN